MRKQKARQKGNQDDFRSPPIGQLEVTSLEDLQHQFRDNEIVLNFDEQTIWAKSRGDSFQLRE